MGFQIETPIQLLEWRGMIADMEGGLVPYLIGPFDERQAPALTTITTGILTTHSDGSPFSDGSLYTQAEVDVQLRDDMMIGATNAVFIVSVGGILSRGMYFSIDGRMFIIRKPPELLSDNRVRVHFLPEARANAKAGSSVNFRDPTQLMQISDPKTGAADIVARAAVEPTIELEESFEGLV